MGVNWVSAGAVRQFRPQVLDQLAHRLGDGFDAFEVENFLVDAFDLSRVSAPPNQPLLQRTSAVKEGLPRPAS